MKFLLSVAVLCLTVLAVSGAGPQSLKSLLTEEEWKASGLDRLTSAELEVIDTALARQSQPTSQLEKSSTPPAPVIAQAATAPTPVTSTPIPSPPVATTPPPSPRSEPATSATEATAPPPVPPAEPSRGWLSRFGLPDLKDSDWRKLPPLQAKVVSWESANRFILDNGQAWEGTDPIPDELIGRSIEIHARPNNRFTLVLDGRNTKVRVARVR